MKRSNMPNLQSKRCILRPLTVDDAKDLYEYYKDEEVLRYLPFTTHKSLNETKRFIKNFFIRNYQQDKISHYAIVLKENNKVIGNIGFNNISKHDVVGEMGVCLNKDYWGYGIVSELVDVMLKFGFEDLELNKIIALHFGGNIGSSKVLEKSRLRYVGKKEEIKRYKGELKHVTCHTYEIYKYEYYKK